MAEEHIVEGGAHVKVRHPFAPLGLSIITLGIYSFYWWYQLNREARDLGERVDPTKSVLAVTIGWFLILPPFISMYNTAERTRRLRGRHGIAAAGPAEGAMIPWLAVLLFIVPILSLVWHAYYQTSLNGLYSDLVRRPLGVDRET